MQNIWKPIPSWMRKAWGAWIALLVGCITVIGTMFTETLMVLSQLSWLHALLFFGGIVLVIFSLGYLIAKLTSGVVEFYETRDKLALARGKLISEIMKTEHVWVSSWTGHALYQTNILKTHRVVKLLLYHPCYDFLKVLARIEKSDVDLYRRYILSVSQDALDNNVCIWWLKEPIIGIVIANAESDCPSNKKWARVQNFIPYGVPDDSPNYVLKQSQYPKLYENIIRAFNEAIKDKGTGTVFKVTQKEIDAERNTYNIPYQSST